jgi:GR25 family glycosyltransferase involved in LPS biosynthesis
MKSYVITIKDLPESVAYAKRCIKSAIPLEVKMFDAITPKDDPLSLLKKENIPLDGFNEVYSNLESCVSAFLSHYTLWKQCIEDNHEYTIFEHDAVVVNSIPDFINYDKVISLGAPSYGKFNTPSQLGVNPLTSKQYFPGAHAYRLKPSGAKLLVERAKVDGGPTDVFIHIKRFPWVQEYYPWMAEVRDAFTTIQTVVGCQAKHRYRKDTYKIKNDWYR